MNENIQNATISDTSTTVQAGINERQFFASMKHMFATSYSVVGELMQNARRAGASRIDFTVDIDNKTATALDDGCGISDFQMLIALCDSGWDEQVQLIDKPFGMGLFSLFFAAERVVFRSNGRALSVTLDDIVNKRDLVVQDDAEFAGQRGTRIELWGLTNPLLGKYAAWAFESQVSQRPQMYLEIESRAQGFPIPVYLNGQYCPRPNAQENLKGEETSIGFVSYRGVTDDAAIIPSQHYKQFYLQGLPIGPGSRSHRQSEPIIVHLDSTQFTARMPDRSELFDAREQIEKVNTVLVEMVQMRLAKLKASMDAKDFALQHWDNCKLHNCMRLMDDVQWIPVKSLRKVNTVCREADEIWHFNRGEDALIARSEFLSGAIKAWRDVPGSTDDSECSTLTLKVMQKLGIVQTFDELSSSHWLCDDAPSVNDLQFTWEVVDESGDTTFWGDLGRCKIRLAKSVKVKVTSRTSSSYCLDADFDSGWLMVPENQEHSDKDPYAGEFELVCYVLGGDQVADHPADALSTFRDESEVFRDEWRAQSVKEWGQAVSALRGASLANMTQAVLARELSNLDGKQATHMCVVRTIQCRHADGGVSNPQADVIDLMDEVFWSKVAAVMLTAGSDVEINAVAANVRRAFAAVVQPGWQEPAISNDL